MDDIKRNKWGVIGVGTALILLTIMMACGSPKPTRAHTAISTPTPTSVPAMPTLPPISKQEIIGVLQAHLEGKPTSVRYKTRSGEERFAIREDIDCRAWAIGVVDRWDARQSGDGFWIVTARAKPNNSEEILRWEWHLFPSGVITTIRGPC